MKTRGTIVAAAVVLALASAGVSVGQTRQETYAVIKLDNGRVYINAGSEEGAATGMQVVLLEAVRTQDQKGNPVDDMIPLGSAPLRYVGSHSSFFSVDSALFRTIRVGTAVRLQRAPDAQKVSVPQAVPESADTQKPKQFSYTVSEFRAGEAVIFRLQPPSGPHKVELRVRRAGEGLFTAVPLVLIQETAEWVGRVEKDFHRDGPIQYCILELNRFNEPLFLAGTPERPLVVGPQSVGLQAPAVQPPAVQEPPKPQRRTDPRQLGFTHNPPGSATIYEVIQISAYAPPPLKAPKLHYRVRGRIEYKEIELTGKPNDFYFYEIPKDEVVEPAIEYYLTVGTPEGTDILVYGNPEAPTEIPVSGFMINPEVELQRHRGHRNMVRLTTEKITFRENDSYEHYELDYLYRIFTTLYSIRMGMGAFRGQGRIQEANPSETLNYYYGYTEAELHFPHTDLSFIGRFLTGINNEGIGNGFESKLRFGDELGVNLVAAVWSASKLGTSSSVQLNVPMAARFGFSGYIAVEDLPVKTEKLGFRMAVDLRYEITEGIDVNARIGMAARTADHIGPNIGLGVVSQF
jgi:hypothetical protein